MRSVMASAALLALALPARPARAAGFDGFERHADRGSLKPFARDLGALLGAGTFHEGRPLGFSGFDAGARVLARAYPARGNKPLRDEGARAVFLPMVQAEIGLPFRLDGFIRGVSYGGLSVAGGGLRVGLFTPSDKPWSPQVIACASAHSAVHRHFSASHAGGNIVASAGTQAVSPFAGVGVDRTRLVALASTADPTVPGAAAVAVEWRATLGLRAKFAQFGYAYAAGSWTAGRPGGDAGLGIRF